MSLESNLAEKWKSTKSRRVSIILWARRPLLNYHEAKQLPKLTKYLQGPSTNLNLLPLVSALRVFDGGQQSVDLLDDTLVVDAGGLVVAEKGHFPGELKSQTENWSQLT